MILKDCLEKIIDNRGRNPKYYDNETLYIIYFLLLESIFYFTYFFIFKIYKNLPSHLKHLIHPRFYGVWSVTLTVTNLEHICYNLLQ